MSENERVCPCCGSKKRKVVLGDDSTFEVMRVEKPKAGAGKFVNVVIVRVVVCAECGTVYDIVKKVK